MKSQQTYNWRVIQNGRIILKPDGNILPEQEHICTAVAIWPGDQNPEPDNVLLTDPCFTQKTLKIANINSSGLGIDLDSIKNVFISHPHADHTPLPPHSQYNPSARLFTPLSHGVFSGLRLVSSPGHHNELQSLVFQDDRNRIVWIVGDAVLDYEWLLDWGYFWPNNYTQDEIIQTWHTIAKIFTDAEIIIPGHGQPIEITGQLVHNLITGFKKAEFAEECPAVVEKLQKRLDSFT